MTGHYYEYNRSKFHYRQFGNGPKLLFCFHGYGRDSYTFSFLGRLLGTRYTIVAIDAPYHGETRWDDPVFRPKDLVKVLEGITAALGKDHQKISLLGFSMGGRIALHLIQHIPGKIEKVVLLAPDGLKFNFWQWFSTHTLLGHKLFDYTMHHPGWLLKLINFTEKRGFISKNVTGFVKYYLQDSEERLTLYRRWIIMRKFRPKLVSVKNIIIRNKISVRMLFGSFDRIIHYQSGQRFLQKIESYATVTIIEAGHDLLREWHSPAIADLFND